ncbi:SIMPL domain-containing protein [Ruegeria sp. 2012CJ41-6]|uniref:SIMPL domain-containing protein n=1 Tax=Ruegeria spongiae TaxID=2942209 RepID=A0ABT0PX81_9RHOB|nr:SIMPL domain-containing protein [Ruegeria spongiae]MCL6282218.1 SIMPL domain-containing protein [Ruegeria spongiae]
MRTLVFLIAVLMAATVGMAQADERRISVTGTGTVAAAPDMATVTLGVSHQADTAQEAMDQTSQAMAAVLDRLTGLGIDKSDIQTQNLSLYPVWNTIVNRETQQQERELTGFAASNLVQVRVRDLDSLGQTLSAVVADGGNEMRGLNFSVSDPEPLLAQARAEAVKDAMDKARQLAEAAGVTLGEVVSINEHGGNGRPMMARAEFAADAGSVPVAAGEVSYNNSVAMVFAIGE